MLKPAEEETQLGRAEVRALFRVPRAGVVAGCYVTEGTIVRGARARVVRDGVVAYDGRIGSLRRFKDDVGEVREGFECGIGLENFHVHLRLRYLVSWKYVNQFGNPILQHTLQGLRDRNANLYHKLQPL